MQKKDTRESGGDESNEKAEVVEEVVGLDAVQIRGTEHIQQPMCQALVLFKFVVKPVTASAAGAGSGTSI